ncbi:MAG TPA: glycosyltransferase [Casimicrobiaceae bacterium]|nr:glycosyltransferase [Casimicrobiaceae bacterium]
MTAIPVDVVVPVHSGFAATRRCLDSVLAARVRTGFETVVVDDATPESAIARYLDGLAGAGRITLLRNERNVGFVASVNRGMALHAERDVVLLNSDTEVANDWLDRLRACAERDSHVGTATPFSNNATICSYPFPGWMGAVPGTLGIAGLDQLFASVNADKSIDLPTGVGSCLYIRRACLEQVGLFDAERFGRGYGEENDFCLRAAATGWRNVLAADVFVFHEGAVSFAGERETRAEAALEALLRAHPDYLDRVRAFTEGDPASPLRAAVDAARLQRGGDEAACVVAERAEERRQLVTRLAEVDALARERETAIAELRAALARAESIVGSRDAEFATLRTEIDNLRAGLAHAEKLAYDRLHEIERIHASPAWKVLAPFLWRR